MHLLIIAWYLHLIDLFRTEIRMLSERSKVHVMTFFSSSYPGFISVRRESESARTPIKQVPRKLLRKERGNHSRSLVKLLLTVLNCGIFVEAPSVQTWLLVNTKTVNRVRETPLGPEAKKDCCFHRLSMEWFHFQCVGLSTAPSGEWLWTVQGCGHGESTLEDGVYTREFKADFQSVLRTLES